MFEAPHDATWWFPCVWCKFSGFLSQVDDCRWLAVGDAPGLVLFHSITTTTKRPSKAKVETFNITQRKGIHWTWYLAKTWTLCFCSMILFRSVVFLWNNQRNTVSSPASFLKTPWILTDFGRRGGWDTWSLRARQRCFLEDIAMGGWFDGWNQAPPPPPRENKVLYGGWFFGWYHSKGYHHFPYDVHKGDIPFTRKLTMWTLKGTIFFKEMSHLQTSNRQFSEVIFVSWRVMVNHGALGPAWVRIILVRRF